MADNAIQIQCPCCHKRLEVDTGTGRVKAVKVERKTDTRELDQLMDAQRGQDEKLSDAFAQAQDAESKRDGQFDDLFQDAVEDAKKHADEKPKRPFDLD